MSGKKWILSDFVSQTQSQHLKASLYSYFNVQKPLGKVVPDGYHFLYFNPKHEEETLSKDGYDAHQQPNDNEFKRRLWVGGEINFIRPLQFNQRSFCVEEIDRFRKVKNTTIVTINREIVSGEDVAIEEKRSLLYTNDLYDGALPTKRNVLKPEFSHILKPTDLLLFRYSALTFNAHKIHWDRKYVHKEGYPNLLVQGPLTITLMLEWVSTLLHGVKVRNFKYKNHSPIFVDQTIQLGLRQDSETQYTIWIEGEQNQLHVSGTIAV